MNSNRCTSRPTELAETLAKRGLPQDLNRWFYMTTETVDFQSLMHKVLDYIDKGYDSLTDSVVTSDLEFIRYLKGRMAEAQMEWENKDTSETSNNFIYYYNLLMEEVSAKLVNELRTNVDKNLSVNWQDTIERYSKHDMEALTLLYGDGLEMYYDKRKEKWVVCAPSGELMSIYYEQEGESIV